MKAISREHATSECEKILHESKAYNIQHSICPSQNQTIDLFLERRCELEGAYLEIFSKLADYPEAFKEILELVTRAGKLWSLEEWSKARQDRKELESINLKIESAAKELANLIHERKIINNRSHFSIGNLHNIVNVIEKASKNNYVYKFHLREPLLALRARFDYKYWPTVEECCMAIASDASESVPNANNAVAEAVTRSQRNSKADFFKALLVDIDELLEDFPFEIPDNFKLSDETIATLGNCILELEANSLVDGQYIKRLRQGMRHRSD
ncbi:hypothetical protein [Maricaulis sp.]|uniref:hypothetical protein n=1 Tax=Maricaulis sp. TaxID=1486257 RepID=UPI00261764B1|nr:hypothetical protein [Maricaulis sp.]